MDLKTVTRVAGENLQAIFGADATAIMLLNEKQNLVESYYEFDKNEGGLIENLEPFPLGVGLTSRVITTGKPLLCNTYEEEMANGAYYPPELVGLGSGTVSESWLGVTLIVTNLLGSLPWLRTNRGLSRKKTCHFCKRCPLQSAQP